jgi:hypothetical protein
MLSLILNLSLNKSAHPLRVFNQAFVCISHFPVNWLTNPPLRSVPSESLSLDHIFTSDVFRALKSVGSSKSAGIYELTAFVYQVILITVYVFFKICFIWDYFTFRKKAKIAPVYKNCNDLCLYKKLQTGLSSSKTFPQNHLFFFINDVLHYLKCQLNTGEHDFTKSKGTTTKLVTYRNI